MDMSEVMFLISRSWTTDSIGQKVPQERRKEVFCNIRSVGQSEWFEAGRNGLKAELQATMFSADYDGEETAEYEGRRYGVYRTYLRDRDTVELYLERKAGA